MERICGDATVTAVDAAYRAGIERFIFVSVHDYNLPSFALNNGYFNGKRRAERQLLSKYPSSGVILRPGFIYGKRRIGSAYLPLDAVGFPLEKIVDAAQGLGIVRPLSWLPGSDLLLAPPVSVEAVAATIIAAITDSSISGIVPIAQIKSIAAGLATA
eukprot:SM001702S03161  [mRNA]  locus=s1702:911:1659:+ [translate_table: standard]